MTCATLLIFFATCYYCNADNFNGDSDVSIVYQFNGDSDFSIVYQFSGDSDFSIVYEFNGDF